MKKQSMFQKAVILLIFSLFCITAVFAGGGSQSASQQSSGAANYTGNRRSYSGYPLPIVEKPLEITGITSYSPLYQDIEISEVWDWFAEQTNIRIKVTSIQDQEKRNLIFASRDFPDIMLSSAAVPVNLLETAAEEGDLLPLDDLVRQYAPSWDRFFNENPITKNAAGRLSDNKLYFLSWVNFASWERGWRYQFIGTRAWLEELGLKNPTTIAEFKNVLTAIKNNTGKGSIPRNAIPYYFLFNHESLFEIYGFFGIPMGNDADYTVLVNNKVVCQAVNPDLKEPLKFLQELYREGLIPPEVFTDDYNAYYTKISSNPPLIGFYSGYDNWNPALQDPIVPLQSPNGKKPLIRSAVFRGGRGMGIFSKCPDPVAVTKFAEFLASDLEASATIARGIKDLTWKFESDGRISQLFWTEDMDKMNRYSKQRGPWEMFIALWDQRFYANHFNNTDITQKNTRGWAYENVYKNHLTPEGSTYVSALTDIADINRMNVLSTDIMNFRSEVFSRWITTNANIDAEWDAYVAQSNNLRLDEYVALKQKGYENATRK
jgi:putative aldouronate transport system substrate-binding protein